MKHIHIISAAVLCVTELAVLAVCAHAQAARVPAVAVQGAERAVHTVLVNGSSRLPYYGALKNLPVSAQWNVVPKLPAASSGQVNAVSRGVFKARQNASVRLRFVLSSRIRLYREEILKGYHLPDSYLEGFFLRRIFPYQQKPNYTADAEEGTLYRGMLITPEELAVIVHKGFTPVSSKWNTGAKAPAVSLSSSSVEAMHYIFQQGFKKDGLGVVFKVRRNPRMELGESPVYNSTKTIYYSYEDIPAEDILEVFVRGEYGLVSLREILERAPSGDIRPHTEWTGQFDCLLR